MAELQFDDYVLLSHANLEAKKIDYSNRVLTVDPESIIRIANAKMADERGNLTEKGVAAATKLQDRVKLLRRGVPFTQRKKSNHFKVAESEGPWLSGTLKKRQYISDGRMFLFDPRPYSSMDVKQGGPEFRMAIPRMVSSVLAKKNLVLVEPVIWQVQTLGGLEIIWMADAEKSTVVPLQAMYFDYVKKKYPQSNFYAQEGDPSEPVQVKVERKTGEFVVGVIATMEVKDKVAQPILEQMEEANGE